MSAPPHVRPPVTAAALGLTAVFLVAVSSTTPRPAQVAVVAGALRPASLTADVAAAPAPARPPGDVRVALPSGVLAITTPYTAAGPLVLTTSAGAAGAAAAPFGSSTDIARAVKIVDTRPAELGFVTQLTTERPGGHVRADGATTHAELVDVQAIQVEGNGLRSTDVHAAAPPDPRGPATPQVVATYGSGLGIGTAWLAGTLELTGTAAGHDDDALTVTFTAF